MRYVSRKLLKRWHTLVKRGAQAQMDGRHPLENANTRKEYAYWIKEIRHAFPIGEYGVTWS
jgi:hypothetical protein